jgi:acyl-CoA synthetase (AMP-forming)/AMP-acid ligase II
MSASNYSRLVELQTVRNGDKVALITEGDTWTYQRLAQTVRAIAAYLTERGVGLGDRVALQGMNSPEFISAVLAIYRVGAIAVPLNYRLQQEELGYLLRNAEVVLLFADGEFTEALDRAAEGMPIRGRVRFDARPGIEGWSPLDRVLVEYDGAATPIAEVAEGDPQRIMYTSGTTSRPKGVVITHRMAHLNALTHAVEIGLSAADRVLVSSPLYHIAAWDAPGLGTLLLGGSLVVMRKFDADTALRMIERHRVTGGIFVQAMLHALRGASDESRDLSSLRWVIFGAAAGELYREIQRMLPTTRLVQAYGMTEACSAIAYIDHDHAAAKRGTVGTAVPFVEFRVADEQDRTVPAGTAGQILLRGPKVTPGYWADPELTAEAWRCGWFHTGDVGVVDEDGFLSITDRLKDMIRSGGENVASQEIERVIYTHPGVLETAVIGVPDPKWQEVPKAYVVCKTGVTISAEELIAHCRASLASFKTPKQVEFVDALPRNPSGKVLKRVLRQGIG